jgi:hypothetical protein
MMLSTHLHPKFQAWLAERKPEDLLEIAADYEALASDPSIAQGHRHAEYARCALLVEKCKARGYSP